jgi:hypothetical protein
LAAFQVKFIPNLSNKTRTKQAMNVSNKVIGFRTTKRQNQNKISKNFKNK